MYSNIDVRARSAVCGFCFLPVRSYKTVNTKNYIGTALNPQGTPVRARYGLTADKT